MAGNKNLTYSQANKQDEFYTRIEDIENECGHYKKFFRDKIILCNCDDPYESMFFQYFAMNFNNFGLKKLISSSYSGSLIVQRELSFEGTPNEIKNFDSKKNAYKANVTEFKDYNGDGREDLEDVKYFLRHHNGAIQKLHGDENFSAGDFRSSECVELLKEADIVVTNPPFSLFRKYVKQLIDFDKKFLIIGNMNNITYQNIFPMLKNNKIWLGYTSGHFWFRVPEYYEEKKTDFKIDSEGQKWRRMGNICWFTNLDIDKRHEEIPLVFSYNEEPEKYPKYDNFDAIEVSKIVEIPKDYNGVMGVPITFIDKYNPNQFKIVGRIVTPEINGKKIYKRILIRRRGAD